MTSEISMSTYPNGRLQTALLEEFESCDEECTRAYYPPAEKNSADHEAAHAERAITFVTGESLRKDLYEAYSNSKMRNRELELALDEARTLVEEGSQSIVSYHQVGLSRLALRVVNQKKS